MTDKEREMNYSIEDDENNEISEIQTKKGNEELVEIYDKDLDDILDEESEDSSSSVEYASDEEEDEEEDDDEDEIFDLETKQNKTKNKKEDEEIENIIGFHGKDKEDEEEEDEDDEEEEEEEDENYLKKFDEKLKTNVIAQYHPEINQHNYEEIEALTTIIRNPQGMIIDPLHRTIPFLTKYEKARILGDRARQINSGAKPLVEIEPFVIDGYLIALKELEEKKIPFILKRPLPNGGVEYWKLKDLEILI